MLVVGASLARAFGIVGAAGLVRYRAKIADPKDAGVMLSTLAVGLACGVGLWLLAGFAMIFILALLWLVESMEPKATVLYTLKVKAKDSGGGQAQAGRAAGALPPGVRSCGPLQRGADLRKRVRRSWRWIGCPAGSRRSIRINISEVAWEDKEKQGAANLCSGARP